MPAFRSVYHFHSIQPVRCNKMRILTADLFRFGIHQFRESLHRAADMLRDRHRGIIVGLQHQGIQQILQIKAVPFRYSQMHLGLGRRIGRNFHLILKISQLQRQNTGHDLCRARHGQRHIPLFSIQNTPGIGIHKHRSPGV